MNNAFKSFISACLVLATLPSLAFAWGSIGNGSANNTTLSIMSASGAGSARSTEPSFTYDSKVNSIPKTQQTVSPAFQAILNSINVSANPGIPSANVKQGLNDALTFNNKLLEGNEYKPQLIAPLIAILNSPSYDTSIKSLALSNLLSIASNQRVDCSQKIGMVNPLIQYMEKTVTAVQSGNMEVSTAEKELSTIDDIFRQVLQDKSISAEEQKDILVSVANDKILYQDSEIKSTLLGIKSSIYVVLVADTDYPLSFLDNSNKDRGKLTLAHSLEKGLDETNDPGFNYNVLSSLNSLLRDTGLSSAEVKTIKDKTSYVLENRTQQDYSLRTICLSTLMNLAVDTRLSETERAEAKELVETYGLNDYNRTIYQDSGILLLAPDNSYYASKTAEILSTALANIPQDKRARTILLNAQLLTDGQASNLVESDALIGLYSFDSDIISIKVGPNYKDSDYISTIYHENTHYIENNLMTNEQKGRLGSIWKEANDINDFPRELGATTQSEYLATTAEAMLMEKDSAQKPLFERAQQQAQEGHPALMQMYKLSEEIWGVS